MSRLNDSTFFPSYSIGATQNSILESVQLGLTENPDVRRMDSETQQKLTEPIVAHYTFPNPATAAVLDNVVPVKTSFLVSGGSVVLFLFLFIFNFPFFHRQARTLSYTHVVFKGMHLAAYSCNGRY